MIRRIKAISLSVLIFVGAWANRSLAEPILPGMPPSLTKISDAQLQSLLKSVNSEPYAAHELGNQLYGAGKTAAAHALWDWAARREPNVPSAAVHQISILIEQGKHDAAKLAFDTVSKQRPLDPHLHIVHGDLALRRGDVAEAEASFQKAHKLSSSLMATNLSLGRFYQLTGRLDEAQAQFRSGIELAPKRPEGWELLARLQFQQANPTGALSSLRQVEQLAPHRIAEAELAELHHQIQDYVGSQLWYSRAVQRKASEPGYWVRLGQSASILEFGDHGRESFERALKLKPDYLPGLMAMAVLEDQQGNIKEAAEFYRRMLKQQPDNITFKHNLGLLLFKLDQSLDEAHGLIESILASAPGDARVEGVLGCILVQLGTNDKLASDKLAKGVLGVPSDAWFRYAYGKVLVRQGRIEEAADQLNGCLIIDPDFPRKEEVLKLIAAAARPIQTGK